MNRKQFNQHINSTLKALREVESRDWYSLLLASANPIDEVGEAVKLIKVAAGYKQFVRECPDTGSETRREAYLLLRAAYDGGVFPPRQHVSKAQFKRLLDMHLSRL
ncbi:MAG: hypothetical protein WC553_03165 [Patescibacteria group bacterium]|jgi:hypothetical protein